MSCLWVLPCSRLQGMPKDMRCYVRQAHLQHVIHRERLTLNSLPFLLHSISSYLLYASKSFFILIFRPSACLPYAYLRISSRISFTTKFQRHLPFFGGMDGFRIMPSDTSLRNVGVRSAMLVNLPSAIETGVKMGANHLRCRSRIFIKLRIKHRAFDFGQQQQQPFP